ncbi:MAG: XkdQ/YqbQ family protein [Acetivibrio ethanolgignens]
MRVRAGCSLLVSLTLDDIRINNYMLVDEVTHTFKENVHTMDVKLIGGDFV